MRTCVHFAALLALSASSASAADSWSKPTTHIRGRLVAEQGEIKGKPAVLLFVELENTGPLRRSVVTHGLRPQ